MDEDKVIAAADLVKDPDGVYGFSNEYIIIRDMSVFGNYGNLVQAINIVAARGWDVVQMFGETGGHMYALCRNTRIKRKREQATGEDSMPRKISND